MSERILNYFNKQVEFSSLLEFFGYNKAAASEVTSAQFFGWVFQFIHNMSKIADKEAARLAAMKPKAEDAPAKPPPEKFGKKIAQGQDPLASLASAMKLGSQITLKNRGERDIRV